MQSNLKLFAAHARLLEWASVSPQTELGELHGKRTPLFMQTMDPSLKIKALVMIITWTIIGPNTATANEHELITWKTKKLTPHFYSEGAFYGDFNRDGTLDVVSGPFWSRLFSRRAFLVDGEQNHFLLDTNRPFCHGSRV